MTPRLRGYGIALLCLVIATACRIVLNPILGYAVIYGLLLISVWASARLGGFGPSLFAVGGGAILAFGLSYSDPTFDWTDFELGIGLILYATLGVIVSLLCRSEFNARWSLIQQLAKHHTLEEISRTNEGRLQAIMDNTTAVIYIKDLHGRFVMANRRFEELSTHGPIVGKTDADIFPRDVVARIQANDRLVRETGRPVEFEEVVPQSDGLHTYVAVKFPLFDSAGQITAIGGISTDISDRKRAADALEAEQEMLRHTINVQDQERQLIAYEIHDGLIQYVTGALMQLEALQAKAESQPAAAVENVVEILRRAVAEGRRLINGIRTPVLDGLGVVAAVEHLIQEEDRAHVEIEFLKDDRIDRMEPKIEEAIYRITQEALTNIGKHSHSKSIRVELGRRGEHVHLEVRDWGVGFRPTSGSTGIHGLRGMMERARIVGGVCKIESAPGEGTRVIADVPYLSRT